MSERADRLGASLRLFGLVREPGHAAVEAAAVMPLLSAEEWEAWRETDDDDRALALACLNVEFELRERQWRALEEFGAAYSAGQGATAEERIKTMPADDARRALLAAFNLGWQHPPIEDDGA